MWWVYAFQRITQTRNTKLTAPTLRQRVWCYPLGGFLCAGFLGLSCCARGSLIAVQRFLTVAASLAAEQTPQRPQRTDSRAASVVWPTGPAVSWLVKSSQTRNGTCVLSISRPSPVHCTTGEARDKVWTRTVPASLSSKGFFQIYLKAVVLNIVQSYYTKRLITASCLKTKTWEKPKYSKKEKTEPLNVMFMETT